MLACLLGHRVSGWSTRDLRTTLAGEGLAHIEGPLTRQGYLQIASELGTTVGKELIALRPGAHAYVAKPGRVPLHTDHAEVDIVAWWCEVQDPTDGATMLLDVARIAEGLAPELKEALREVELWCPPLSGGPPTLRFPVIQQRRDRDAVFCSPWLRCASELDEHQRALDHFRDEIRAAARTSVRCVRLRPGEALFVDNGRWLHGRGPIEENSPRRLFRLWLADKSTNAELVPSSIRPECPGPEANSH
jgi:hypothetical protein